VLELCRPRDETRGEVATKKLSKSAAQKKRSDAAKRGAQTRKANIQRAAKQAAAAQKKRSDAAKRGAATRKANAEANRRATLSAYDKRNEHARQLGYNSYWDERQSRLRAREALAKIGQRPGTRRAPTLVEVDHLGLLGRGKKQQDLFYDTKALIENQQGPTSDHDIWQIIRVFYKRSGS
jgi:hypothetical protein